MSRGLGLFDSCDPFKQNTSVSSKDDDYNDFGSPEEALERKGIYYLYGEIAEGSLLDIHQDVLLKHLTPSWKDDIQIFINSPGGDCAELWALIDLLEFVRMDIQTIGIGQICSAAAILLAAGTKGKRKIAPNGHIMIHQFSTIAMGNVSQLVAETRAIEQEQARHINFWKTHTNLKTDQEVISTLLTGVDLNLSPEEALRLGIVDQIVGKTIEAQKPLLNITPDIIETPPTIFNQPKIVKSKKRK